MKIYNLFLYGIAAFHAALLTPALGQNLVVDGNFGSGAVFEGNFGTLFETDADEGWHIPAAHRWTLASGRASVTNTSGAPGLAQAIRNQSSNTGGHELSFRLTNTEGDATDNQFRVQLFGINGTFSLGHWNTNTPSGATVIVDTGELAGGTNRNNQPLTYPADLAGGFEYLAIRVWGTNVNPAGGDVLTVDDIVLAPVQEPVLGEATVEIAAGDGDCGETWPEEASFVVRRDNVGIELTVAYALGGNAVRLDDYNLHTLAVYDADGATITTSFNWLRQWNSTLVFPADAAELVISLKPKNDNVVDRTADFETCTFTLLDGEGYNVNPDKDSASVTIWEADVPSREEAVRFLIQASFGPGVSHYNGSYRDDIDIVQDIGFANWVDWQMSQPIQRLDGQMTSGIATAYNYVAKSLHIAFMHSFLGYPVPTTGQARPRVNYDPLRQRIGYALSQILVISDKLSAINVEAEGMAHYFDEALLRHAFGNYRDVLTDVSLHPLMGVYLSHLRNRAATFETVVDPITGVETQVQLTSPDENYAREILQLFSIGTLLLNPDGTPKTAVVDGEVGAISSYGNTEIEEFARVFTGLTFSDATNFRDMRGRYDEFMASIDYEFYASEDQFYHDLDPKVLLAESPVNKTLASSADALNPNLVQALGDSATFDDLTDAIDNIFYHPNVGPFLSRLLIQRFIMSNPDKGYLRRVAAKFNNNGSGVRGDLGAVVKQMLLDNEARLYNNSLDEQNGALREPYLRVLHLLRTFPVQPNANGFLTIYYLDNVVGQRPLAAPSVFNFYLPDFIPPDAEAIENPREGFELSWGGLVAPEFQISTGGNLTNQLDFMTGSVNRGVNGFGGGLKYDFSSLYALADDPDALVRELDLRLCAGRLLEAERKVIVDTLRKLNPDDAQFINASNQAQYRVETAVGLTIISPSFCILR